MAMANVFIGFFFLFADWGFGLAAVQAKDVDRDQLRRVFGVVVVTNAAGCVLALSFAPLVASFFGEPRLAGVIRVLSLNFLLLAACVLPQSLLLRDMDFRTKARVDVLAMALSALVGLGMAAAGRGVWALVGSSVVTYGVKAVAYNIVRPVALTPAFQWAVGPLGRFGVLVTLDRVLFFLYGQADVFIGGRVLGKEALGLYAVALSLAAVPMEKLLPVINQVSFAAFARIQAEPDRVRRNLLRAVQLVSLTCFPLFAGMAVVAGDLVPVVLGERWQALIVPFQLLCLVLPLKAVYAVFSPALLGIGRPGVNGGNMGITLATMSVAILAGVQFGVLGLCLAWVIAYPAVFVVVSRRSLQALDTRYREFLRCAAAPALGSIAMAAGVLALRALLHALGPSPLRLAILAVTGIGLYGVFILMFQRAAVRDLFALARS
jgi:O-antigen/teichoic acid export membrane protein